MFKVQPTAPRCHPKVSHRLNEGSPISSAHPPPPAGTPGSPVSPTGQCLQWLSHMTKTRCWSTYKPRRRLPVGRGLHAHPPCGVQGSRPGLGQRGARLGRSLPRFPPVWAASSQPLARRSSATYLLEEEGSETAWTMSVDSASRTLVRNSFFLAPGQPGVNRVGHAQLSETTGHTERGRFPWRGETSGNAGRGVHYE